jgi:O-Antigen ligase
MADPAQPKAPRPRDAAEPRAATALRWAGLGLVLAAVFVRALVAIDPLPHWSTDPLVMQIPMTEVGPAASLLLDVATFVGLALVLGAVGATRERVPLVLLGLMGIGLVPVAWHAGVGSGGMRDLDNTWLGFNWAAAIASGVACFIACRDQRLRRVTVASLLGLSFMLAARGALQYFIEHHDTLAAFERTKDAFFQSKGWEEGSAIAKGYVRRLEQPEATGWFGLANVYATLVAASVVGLGGLAIGAVRARLRGDDEITGGWLGLMVAGVLAAGMGLALSGSRAGQLAVLVGAVAMGLVWFAHRKPADTLPKRWGTGGGLFALAAAIGVVALVAIQPALGDRALDLSLRFRGFYVWGASQIALDHPLLGVGPGDFQDAYTLAKPAGAPENVASPHSVAFDLIATLGVAGAAWVLVWATLAFRTGCNLFQTPGRANPEKQSDTSWHERRIDFAILLALTAVPTLISAWIEAAATTPDRVIARMIGLAGWLGVAAACVAVMRRVPNWPAWAAAAGVALFVHAQLDVAPVTFGSSAWMLALLGALAVRTDATKHGSEDADQAPIARPLQSTIASVAVTLVAIFIATWAWIPTARFERSLAAAAEALNPLTSIGTRIDAIGSRQLTAQGDSMPLVASDLGRMLNIDPPRTQESFTKAMDQLLGLTAMQAREHLASAMQIYPANVAIGRARANLALRRAEALARVGGPDGGSLGAVRAEIASALSVEEALVKARPTSPGAWAALGSTAWRASRIDAAQRQILTGRAIDAWLRAADLDPQGILFPVRLHDVYLERGENNLARDWAVRALEADNALALDPLVGLTDAERARLKQTAQNP